MVGDKKLNFVKKLIRILVSKLPESLLGLYYKLKIYFKLKNVDSIYVVYAIGKVGSNYVASLLEHNVSEPVFHLHRLSDSGISKMVSHYKNSARNSIPGHLYESIELKRQLGRRNISVTYITLFRNPIERLISSIFQDAFVFDVFGSAHDLNNKTLEELHKASLNPPEDSWILDDYNEYFQCDLLEDLKDYDFDSPKYFSRKCGAKSLVLRLENGKIADKLEKLGHIDIKDIAPTNTAKNKYYASDYSRLQLGSLDEVQANFYKNSALVRILYPNYEQK